ncbi:PBP2_Bug_TTT domain containing protein [Burkholderiaceae bacterium]
MKFFNVKHALLLALSFWACHGVAQDVKNYPNRSVKLVVPFTAGSTVDVLGRAIGEELQAEFNQPFVVDNRAGASTLLAAKLVAAAPADGYTLLFPTVTTLSLGPQLMAAPGFDPFKDVSMIARLGLTNFFLVVTPSFPARNMKEWIELIRKNPGKYSYGSSGSGSPQHIFMELLKKDLNLDIVHIPYKGSNSSMMDLLSGKVQMAFLDGTLAIPHLKTEKLFTVGTSMAKRTVLIPSVPPIADTVPGFDWSGWIAFAGPPNMPSSVVDLLAEKIRRFQATPAYTTLLNKAAMEPSEPMTPAMTSEFVKKEYKRWTPVIAASGAAVD